MFLFYAEMLILTYRLWQITKEVVDHLPHFCADIQVLRRLLQMWQNLKNSPVFETLNLKCVFVLKQKLCDRLFVPL